MDPGTPIEQELLEEELPPPSSERGLKRPSEAESGAPDPSTDTKTDPKPRAKRMKFHERYPQEPRNRPPRERKQLVRFDYLGDKELASMEMQAARIEKRRAAFYNSQSYTGQVFEELPVDSMSMQERDAFPKMALTTESKIAFLRFRNAILDYWGSFTEEYLHFSTFMQHLGQQQEPITPEELRFIHRLWKFLHVNHRINPNSKTSEDFEALSPNNSDEETEKEGPKKDKPTGTGRPRGRPKGSSAAPSSSTPAKSPGASHDQISPNSRLNGDRHSSGKDTPSSSYSKSSSSKASASRDHRHEIPSYDAGFSSPLSSVGLQTDGQEDSRNSSPGALTDSPFSLQSSKLVKLKIIKSSSPKPEEESALASPTASESSTFSERLNALSEASELVSGPHATLSTSASASTHKSSRDSSQHYQSHQKHRGGDTTPDPIKSPRVPHSSHGSSTTTLRAERGHSTLAESRPRRARAAANNNISRRTEDTAAIYNTLPPTEIPLFPVICREFQLPISASSLKVCIIGAGISGLAAAQFLHQHGVQHITVLESRLRMGGRIFTVHANGVAVELGAQYVQDHELNPVADICAQLELPTSSFDPTEHHGLLQKMLVSDEVFAPPPIEEAYSETNGDSSAPHSKRSQANGEGSPRELGDKPNTTDKGSGVHLDDIAANSAWRALHRFGTHPSNLSAQQSLESHDYTYAQSMMTTGLSELVRNLGIGIDVRLGFSVETINYNSIYRSDSVLVRFKDDECQTHSEVFDVVLVTVPLGVLKAGTIRFEPPLPSSKQDALSRLAVGHQNVIALIFEYQFWERSETASEPTVLYENEAKGICMVSMPHWGHRPVVQVSFFGDSAKVLESAQPDVLVPSLVETLRSNFKQVPRVVGYIWAPWSSDPNCLGAHSFVPKSENSSLRTALAEPLHLGRIGFAGEHTHTNHPSTLHGAYESGIREARRIIDLFTEKNVGEYVFPFETAVGATYSSDLPWTITSEETEELQASILQGLPNMVVSIPPVDPCS